MAGMEQQTRSQAALLSLGRVAGVCRKAGLRLARHHTSKPLAGAAQGDPLPALMNTGCSAGLWLVAEGWGVTGFRERQVLSNPLVQPPPEKLRSPVASGEMG